MCFSKKLLIILGLELVLLEVTVTKPLQLIQIRPGTYLINIKFFNTNQYNNGTVSKFPPIIEYVVQRIQAQNSNYVYEDLSRPPTYDKPVYTLSPSEQLTAHQPLVVENVTEAMIVPPQEDSEIQSTTSDGFEYEELEETTEKFFEIISQNNNREKHEILEETTTTITEALD